MLQKRFHFKPKFFIRTAGPGQKRGSITGFARERVVIELLNAAPSVRIHVFSL
jgi:hypothetical protein